MREMQRREEGRLVTGIQRHHETVEHGERCLHRSLIRSIAWCFSPIQPTAARKMRM